MRKKGNWYIPDLVRVALTDRLGCEEEGLESGEKMAGLSGSTMGHTLPEPLGTVMLASGEGEWRR